MVSGINYRNIPITDFHIQKENDSVIYYEKIKDTASIIEEKSLIYLKSNEETFSKVEDVVSFFSDSEKNKDKEVFKRLNTAQLTLEGITDNFYQITEYKTLENSKEQKIDSLSYAVQLVKNWKKALDTVNKNTPFFERKALMKKSNTEVEAHSLLLETIKNFDITHNSSIKTTKILAKRIDEEWQIQLYPESIPKEEAYILKYIGDYYLTKNKGYEWFTRNSENLKSNVEYKNLGRKMKDTKSWIEKHLIFW